MGDGVVDPLQPVAYVIEGSGAVGRRRQIGQQEVAADELRDAAFDRPVGRACGNCRFAASASRGKGVGRAAAARRCRTTRVWRTDPANCRSPVGSWWSTSTNAAVPYGVQVVGREP